MRFIKTLKGEYLARIQAIGGGALVFTAARTDEGWQLTTRRVPDGEIKVRVFSLLRDAKAAAAKLAEEESDRRIDEAVARQNEINKRYGAAPTTRVYGGR